MARSAQAFVRGTTEHFYSWLEESAGSSLPEGPPVWICGDCHYGNFGPVASTTGQVAIALRDFDQAVIGNPTHDLIRLALSLATAVRDCNLSGVTIVDMVEALCAAYKQSIQFMQEEDCPPPKCVQGALKAAYHRNWEKLARERADGSNWCFPRGKRFWALTSQEEEAIRRLFADPVLLGQVLGFPVDAKVPAVRFEDAAYWVKGCSSLGLLRIAVLLRVNGGDAPSWRLIDVKEAVEAKAPRKCSARLPPNQSDRVVTAARVLSPYIGSRMASASLEGKSVFARELLPQDLKLEITSLSPSQAISAAHHLAAVLGRAHASQIGTEDRRAWGRELDRGWTMRVDAPNWLWSAIVSLMTIHQGAYLEHCRLVARIGA